MTLTCTTDSSNPASSITWYKNGKPITSNTETKELVGENGGLVTSQILKFVPSRDMDGQTVECKAFNEISKSYWASSLVILDLRCEYIKKLKLVYQHA